MTLKDLVSLYRAQSQDLAEPFYCSDALLTIYANEAQKEACRRSPLLVLTSTIDISAGDESIQLNPQTVRITRALVGGQMLQVHAVDVMDEFHPGWQDARVKAAPMCLVSGLATDELYMWPQPDAAFTMRLTAQCLPQVPLKNEGDQPEIREELHPALVDWILHRVYSQEDSQIFNPAKAQLHEDRFISEFGRKASGRNEEWVRAGQGLMPGPIA